MVDLVSNETKRMPLPCPANLIKAFHTAPDMFFVGCNIN